MIRVEYIQIIYRDEQNIRDKDYIHEKSNPSTRVVGANKSCESQEETE